MSRNCFTSGENTEKSQKNVYVIAFLVKKNLNWCFEYNKIVNLTAADGRAMKLNNTCFGG